MHLLFLQERWVAPSFNANLFGFQVATIRQRLTSGQVTGRRQNNRSVAERRFITALDTIHKQINWAAARA